MAINVSVQYNGGFLPDIILLTQCYYHRGIRLYAMKVTRLYAMLTQCYYHWGIRSNAIKRFCLGGSLCCHLKRFDNFSPCLGDARKV